MVVHNKLPSAGEKFADNRCCCMKFVSFGWLDFEEREQEYGEEWVLTSPMDWEHQLNLHHSHQFWRPNSH